MQTWKPTWVYIDYRQDRRAIFSCSAADILDADQKLQAATGIDARAMHIGCYAEHWMHPVRGSFERIRLRKAAVYPTPPEKNIDASN